MKTRMWKIYGIDGHRQKESFAKSTKFATNDGGAWVEVLNADKTGTNDYSILKIQASHKDRCYTEMYGQITDGIFENCKVGMIEELDVKLLVVRFIESGAIIDEVETVGDGLKMIQEFEEQDKWDGCSSNAFYEVAEIDGDGHTIIDEDGNFRYWRIG